MLALEILKVLAPIATAALGGSGVWAYMSRRHRNKAVANASVASSQADLATALAAQTRILLGENAKDRKDLKRVVQRQSARIDFAMAQVAECNKRHADCEDNVANLRAELEKLMGGHVATYPNGAANASD